MKEDMQIFENSEFGQITVIEQDKEPWFIAKEISEILEYSATEKMTRRLDEDEKANVPFRDIGSNQNRNQIVISESGLYEAIFGSHKPEAKKFKKWITKEVLPSIRKNGGYIIKKENETHQEIMAKALKIANITLGEKDDTITNQALQIEQSRPMVEFAEQVDASIESVELGIFAKAINHENINIGRNRLFKYLKDNNYLMDDNIPYQKYVDNNYFEVVEKVYSTMFGNRIYYQCYIKGRGQIAIFNKLKQCEEFNV